MSNWPKYKEIINIQAYKHDGTLYRQYNGAQVIENSPTMLVLFLIKTKVKEKTGDKWVVREPTIWWFPKNDFYNTNGIIRKSGTNYYTNLSSPPFFEEGHLKYIDYDLDIRSSKTKAMKLYDKRDWKVNQVKMDYSQNIIKKINNTVDFLYEEIQNGEGIFNEDYVNSYIEDLANSRMFVPKFLQ